MGQSEEGLRVIAEALSIGDRSGEGRREAETCFRQALAVARRQQAKSWELLATMSLGRLSQRQGMREEAYSLLAPIYDWFTEGFDTGDPQEARALLQELFCPA